MGFELTDDEWALMSGFPVSNLVDLAADLDLAPPEQIDRRALLNQCVPRMVDRFRAEGIPLSKYDQDDLEALSPAQLEAIARLQGVKGRATVAAVLKVGRTVYKTYQKNRPDNPVALMVPSLLTAVARAADAG